MHSTFGDKEFVGHNHIYTYLVAAQLILQKRILILNSVFLLFIFAVKLPLLSFCSAYPQNLVIYLTVGALIGEY